MKKAKYSKIKCILILIPNNIGSKGKFKIECNDVF